MTTAVRPGQIWLVDLGAPVGNEQGGTRPAVVVGSEDHCRFPIRMALVVPLTTRDRGLPHHVPIVSRDSGVSRASWARTDDIRAVATARFVRTTPIGRLDDDERAEVSRWVHRMLD